MRWYHPNKKAAPQGKKILYFKNGDIYVVQRFGEYWLPIPFADSEFAFHEAPDLWADIVPPLGYTGRIYIHVSDNANDKDSSYDLDALQQKYPEIYKELVVIYSNPFREAVECRGKK